MSAESPSSLPAPRPRNLRRSLIWAGVVVASLGMVAVSARELARGRFTPLPKLGALPDFTFTRQDGQPWGSKQLRGHPFVANFIFTRCPTVCPVFTQKMARVQEHTAALGPRLQLVSFSVDPAYDTPERLAEYGQKYRADFARWSFLTGDYGQLKNTIVQGFKISMGREPGAAEDDLLSIFHGTHFVLVDGTGEIRGYYDSADPEATERLETDAHRLASDEG
ncbi:SCO family protein [Corallococcus sp. CA053C]|uniref:SCO family protein n=1 Tax=Corallococcus sp. CA053C TaxID=2316732 RepID=UPI000EA192F5|nr:SCO family protein [Corallococcus sp. CA053C]RKG96686.1 SCO family protein [Corallococcus sp. CA053C]